ncbi:LytTR family DNA-binding domain-containing protein [Pricia sp. S334]|uniref:LytTR family DNA-binding domain-containing protein n=1 Tax=Pricia mediterranea TaxID=3076079 RepID=A0ABU3L4P9_9FLAO|nr:LytTR family DNA-binding domain-containing protein [Pricia sp. S334]MDT7828301.1 LytTR family DNA-binding domain-containing protein [Pricia sp. S334]
MADTIFEFWDTLFQVGLVVIVPYALFVWYSEIKYRFSEFEHIQADKNEPSNHDPNKLLVFHDHSGKMIFAIKFSQLLYVKSAGNYLELYYRKEDETLMELIRASIKELEDKIVGTDVIRIHRSFLVNMERVSSFKKTRKGYAVQIQYASEMVPVSSGFKTVFEEILQQKVSH